MRPRRAPAAPAVGHGRGVLIGPASRRRWAAAAGDRRRVQNRGRTILGGQTAGGAFGSRHACASFLGDTGWMAVAAPRGLGAALAARRFFPRRSAPGRPPTGRACRRWAGAGRGGVVQACLAALLALRLAQSVMRSSIFSLFSGERMELAARFNQLRFAVR